MVQAYQRRTMDKSLRRTVVRERQLDTGSVMYDRRWREASEAWLKQYPFCVLCLCYGQVNECVGEGSAQRGLVVDHIVPHKGNSRLFWDQDNWQTLGMRHHNRDKKSCEWQGKDWFAMLRDIVQQKQTMSHLMDYSQWVPPVVASALGVGRVEL